MGKCSVDEGCGLRAIPAGQRGRGDGWRHREPPDPEPCSSPALSPRSPLCTAMTGRWCCVKLLSRGEESWGDGLLKGDLSISVFFTVGEMPVGGQGEVLWSARPQSVLPWGAGLVWGAPWGGCAGAGGVHRFESTWGCVGGCAPARGCASLGMHGDLCACRCTHVCRGLCTCTRHLCATVCSVHSGVCMHTCACMCVLCVSVCVCVCLRASAACTAVHGCACMCTQIHMRVHECVCVPTCAGVRACASA